MVTRELNVRAKQKGRVAGPENLLEDNSKQPLCPAKVFNIDLHRIIGLLEACLPPVLSAREEIHERTHTHLRRGEGMQFTNDFVHLFFASDISCVFVTKEGCMSDVCCVFTTKDRNKLEISEAPIVVL